MQEHEAQEILADFRKAIDDLDDEIVTLLAKRLNIIDQVAKVKKANNIDPHLQGRIDEVINRNTETAKKLGADADLINSLYKQIVENAIGRETDFINKK